MDNIKKILEMLQSLLVERECSSNSKGKTSNPGWKAREETADPMLHTEEQMGWSRSKKRQIVIPQGAIL